MPRSDTVYVCQSCGSVHAKWAGRCDACGSWNTLAEETNTSAPLGGGAKASPARSGRRSKLELVDLGSATEDPKRYETGIAELDRVAGGGLVPGSAVLVGGDPGIGKSTLLLQAVARLALAGTSSVYVSGEEAADQVRRRARRLGLADSPVALAAETSLEVILDGLKKESPQVAIIDSIQTLWSDSWTPRRARWPRCAPALRNWCAGPRSATRP